MQFTYVVSLLTQASLLHDRLLGEEAIVFSSLVQYLYILLTVTKGQVIGTTFLNLLDNHVALLVKTLLPKLTPFRELQDAETRIN